MKKLVISLVVFTAVSLSTIAQNYQPFPTESATWRVIRCFSFYPPGWYDEYKLIMDGSDTIYNGSSYKKIYISNHHLPGTTYDTIYPTEFFGGLRESAKQIFMWQKWASADTSVHLIYDFNYKSIGDTIYTSCLAGGLFPVGHVVAAVDSVMIGTKFHKRLHLHDPNSTYIVEYWIEGVGSSWGLPFASFWTISDNSYDLLCFHEEQSLMYINPSPTYTFCLSPLPVIACDSVITNIPGSISKNISLNIYPNPAADILTLEINQLIDRSVILHIYNVMGVLVRMEILNQNLSQINILDLPNGVYSVVLKSRDYFAYKKLIIQR